MFDRQQLETFAAVVECRHFGQAANALNISRGAVSQRILALEEALGTPLVVRDGCAPTPAGETLLQHIQTLKMLEAHTLERIKPDARGRTKVSIAVNADSLATWFGPVAFAIAKEDVALELVVDDQDHTLAVLTRGDAMGCISTARTAATGFVAEPIGAMEYVCVSAPSFARSHFPLGLNLRDILVAPAVLFNRKDRLHAIFLEQLLGFPVNGYTKHYFPSPEALLSAVRAGIGYGLVPAMQVRSLIESGELVVLAPGDSVSVDLYWHHWIKAPPNAQAISEVIMNQARHMLNQPPPASSAGLEEDAAEG
ncbi:HTH-type transcriptional regulator ArgP [Burkholderia cenocepacia]|nr:HTH-type transcriptional regulator ArgP [Burkholderia cenocepacia]